MRLILARHGNTFGPGQTPVWVGAREDLPLTDKGEAQSSEFGKALKDAGIMPARIIAGPLQRTASGARLAAAQCGFEGPVEIDDRLREIDYGSWGGRSDDDIAGEWGPDAVENWRERSIAPEGAGWSPAPEVIADNARALLSDITASAKPSDTVFLVSSNGILRYFHPLLGGAIARPDEAKMRTGHWSLAVHEPSGWKLVFWNELPDARAVGGNV